MHCAEHFAIYTYITSLCCIPETNIIYMSVIYVSLEKHYLAQQFGKKNTGFLEKIPFSYFWVVIN